MAQSPLRPEGRSGHSGLHPETRAAASVLGQSLEADRQPPLSKRRGGCCASLLLLLPLPPCLHLPAAGSDWGEFVAVRCRFNFPAALSLFHFSPPVVAEAEPSNELRDLGWAPGFLRVTGRSAPGPAPPQLPARTPESAAWAPGSGDSSGHREKEQAARPGLLQGRGAAPLLSLPAPTPPCTHGLGRWVLSYSFCPGGFKKGSRAQATRDAHVGALKGASPGEATGCLETGFLCVYNKLGTSALPPV